MADLRRSNDLKPPIAVHGLYFRPSPKQLGEALFWVDTPKREDNALGLGSRRRSRRLGQIDPVWDNRDRVCKAEIADLLVLLFAGRVHASRTADRRTLK